MVVIKPLNVSFNVENDIMHMEEPVDLSPSFRGMLKKLDL